MKRGMARFLTGLYPLAWRKRYGIEFRAMLEDGPGDLRTVVNVVSAALTERIMRTIRGGNMNAYPQSLGEMTKQPSAFLPMTMSVIALATVFLGPVIFHDGQSADEGPTAHIWQILMAGQLPLVAYFAIKWVRRVPGVAAKVLGLQAGALLANLATVFLLGVG